MPSTKLSFCLKGMSPHPPQSRGRAKGEKRADRHNKKEKPSSRRLPFQSERHTRKSPFPAHLEEGGRPASEGLALLSSSTLLNDPLILSSFPLFSRRERPSVPPSPLSFSSTPPDRLCPSLEGSEVDPEWEREGTELLFQST